MFLFVFNVRYVCVLEVRRASVSFVTCLMPSLWVNRPSESSLSSSSTNHHTDILNLPITAHLATAFLSSGQDEARGDHRITSRCVLTT